MTPVDLAEYVELQYTLRRWAIHFRLSYTQKIIALGRGLIISAPWAQRMIGSDMYFADIYHKHVLPYLQDW